MKFSGTVGVLRDALSPCARVAMTKSPVPILANVLLEAEGQELRITCSNLDQTVVAIVPVFVEKSARITVAAAVLARVLDNLATEAECEITLDAKQDLIVKCSRSKSTLRTLPADDFPEIKPEFTASLDFEPAVLTKALGAVGYAAETDDTRAYLCGVYISSIGSGGIDFVATNGYRLSLASLTMDAKFSPIILPSSALKQFAGALSKASKAKLSLSASMAMLSVDKLSITTRTIDGTFPDYRRLVGVPKIMCAAVKRSEFLGAVNVAGSTSNEHAAVNVEFGAGQCTVRGVSADAGSSESQIDADVENEFVGFFNAHFLAEAILAIDGDVLRVFYNGAKSALHLFGGNDDRHAIVMTRAG